jgi:uroporphyrinogen decarboxylase
MLPYHWLKGQLEAAVVEYYTDLEVMHEYRDLFHRYNVRKAALFLEGGVDFLLIESSGSLTMQSPEIFEDMQLETIKVITRMYKEAGVPTMFHSCGISQALLPILAEKTDLDGIQPLEPPPTGDIDLAGTKREFGSRLALMGNLNTPELMLRGTAEDVFDASRAAIEAAKDGGGFILSTGDQCGRDTPDENICAMLRAVEEVGRY